MAFNVEKIRADFPLLSRKVNGKRIAYLDNAATTQKPRVVLDAMREYYETENANAHRGGHMLAEEATLRLENARKRVARFIGALPSEIVFTRNATESLNFVSSMTAKKGTRVLLTQMEHHSNVVNWQIRGAKLDYASMRSHGMVCTDDVEKKLLAHPAIFSFTHASNVLGTVNDAAKLCRMAKKAGALSCVDAAQSIPHMKVDAHALGCDFLAFSAHKIMGPTGLGVLYIRKELGETLEPVFGGGGMIESVGLTESDFARAPQKFEAGTQDVAGAVGLEAAIGHVEKLGFPAMQAHGKKCWKACVDSLGSVKGTQIYGNGSETGIVSFNIGKLHAHDIAQIASEDGIMLRAGHHCAQPLMDVLGVPATARASFYLYNTEEEAGRLVESVKRAVKKLG